MCPRPARVRREIVGSPSEQRAVESGPQQMTFPGRKSGTDRPGQERSGAVRARPGGSPQQVTRQRVEVNQDQVGDPGPSEAEQHPRVEARSLDEDDRQTGKAAMQFADHGIVILIVR